MPAIANTSTLALDRTRDPAAFWDVLAAQVSGWAGEQGLVLRDAVVLLPFVALLEPARAAFARRGGWQPRIETPLTLADSLPPLPPGGAAQLSGEASRDRLAAWSLAQRSPWADALAPWAPDERRAALQAIVAAAQSVHATAAAVPPAARAAWWAALRAGLPLPSGPAAPELSWLHLAIDWASDGAPPRTDALWSHQPGGWVAVRLGGADRLCEALLQAAAVPSLLIDADPDPLEPYAGVVTVAEVERLRAADFESEAMAAASTVLQARAQGRTPVALVTLDRELTRRVRALLDRHRVPVLDETGWTLSSTPAAARVLALLQAAQPAASRDQWLQALKAWPGVDTEALDTLEARWRERRRATGPAQQAAADALLAAAQARLQPLAAPGRWPLPVWLQRLHDLLRTPLDGHPDAADPASADGTLLAELRDTAEGQQVLAALRLVPAGTGHPTTADTAWAALAAGVHLSAAELLDWVRETLEDQPFLPTPDAGASVLITPLARAFARPLGHVVLAGADPVHLSAGDAATGLIGDALARRLGLPHLAERRERLHLWLAQALAGPRVTLLRRAHERGEPLGESLPEQWLLLARARAARPPWPLQTWAAPLRTVAAQPQPRPLPSAPASLPDKLSATQLKTLRTCPYRFFARAVLRLDEPAELDTAMDKRDYGNWLHAVLHRFHAERDDAASTDRAHDHDALMAAAERVAREHGLDEAERLPWQVSFERLVPAYLHWLAQREAQGWRWQAGEFERERRLPGVQGLVLRGTVDRLDRGPGGAHEILDYKTGRVADLIKSLDPPSEDTQLAFYSALLGAEPGMAAAYLALDDDEAPLSVPHPQVHRTATRLLQELAAIWQRLQAGAPMPALGEGRVCELCEARGLCRRDHWGPA